MKREEYIELIKSTVIYKRVPATIDEPAYKPDYTKEIDWDASCNKATELNFIEESLDEKIDRLYNIYENEDMRHDSVANELITTLMADRFKKTL